MHRYEITYKLTKHTQTGRQFTFTEYADGITEVCWGVQIATFSTFEDALHAYYAMTGETKV